MSLGRERNHGCRISEDWRFKGMRTLILENDQIRIVIVVDKGTDIVEFRYKPLDLDPLLFLPGGIRNPKQDSPSAYTDEPFHDYYSGGWNDILPSGGAPSSYKGAIFGQHGEISLIPWETALLEDTPQRVSVRCWTRSVRTPFFVEKTYTLEVGRATLQIEESVTNEAGEPMPLTWVQHVAFGRPFLDEGAVIDVPAKRISVHEPMPGYEPRRFQPGVTADWPLTPTPDGDTDNASQIPAYGAKQAQVMAYILDLEDGWYAVTNQVRKVGFALRFDRSTYPYIWYWQQLGNVAEGYPWWSRTHCAALEPATYYPGGGLGQAVDQGTALILNPGESIQTSLRATIYAGLNRVNNVSVEGDVS
ncbi:MAG: DUF4432 family protein [Chloroflexota bacterium]